MKQTYHLSRKAIAILIFLVFALSLIPLFWLGIYAHPSADDFTYGLITSQTWRDTGSFSAVVQSAVSQAAQTYENWQGSFAAVFLMSLQPAVFGEEFYFLTPIILILSLVLSSYFLGYVLLCKICGCRWENACIILSAALFLTIQFIYYPVEGFYWFNGGIYYTFFYSLASAALGLILLAVKSQKTFCRILSCLVAVVLFFIIGAGNYTTALTVLLLPWWLWFFSSLLEQVITPLL